MGLDGKKLFIQFYGLGHLILGACLLVGLSAGYFLKEAVLVYPREAVSALFDSDLLALSYLAVFLAGVFHIAAGILIARLSEWVRYWFYYGWPIMTIIKFGLAYTYYESWVHAGYVSSIMEILSWPKVIIFIGIVGFDLGFIATQITQMNASFKEELDKERLSYGRIFTVLFIAVFTLSMLLYLGKPIKKGFHKGFYKTKGEYEPSQEKPIEVKIKEEMPIQSQDLTPKMDQEDKEINTPTETLSVPAVKEQGKGVSIIAPDKKIEEEVRKEGVAYVQILGWLGALTIIVGFVFYFLNQLQLYFTLLGFGFFCWAVYAIALSLWPVILASVCVVIFSVLYFVQKTSR